MHRRAEAGSRNADGNFMDLGLFRDSSLSWLRKARRVPLSFGHADTSAFASCSLLPARLRLGPFEEQHADRSPSRCAQLRRRRRRAGREPRRRSPQPTHARAHAIEHHRNRPRPGSGAASGVLGLRVDLRWASREGRFARGGLTGRGCGDRSLRRPPRDGRECGCKPAVRELRGGRGSGGVVAARASGAEALSRLWTAQLARALPERRGALRGSAAHG